MTTAFPEPTDPAASRAEVLLRYLAWFRDQVAARVASLPEEEARRSRVPSGWTPLELVTHLRHVERRWIEWGFEGRRMPDPWGDEREGRWWVSPDATPETEIAAWQAQAAHTGDVVAAHALDDVGAPGPRWEGRPPATLERVLLHLLQEFARHAGHLDVVVEQAGGTTGE